MVQLEGSSAVLVLLHRSNFLATMVLSILVIKIPLEITMIGEEKIEEKWMVITIETDILILQRSLKSCCKLKFF